MVPDFEKYDWSSVKVILVYAAPVPVTLLKEYARRASRCGSSTASRNAPVAAAVIDGEHALTKAGSCGLPMFHTEIRLVDDDGHEVGPEELGEVSSRARIRDEGLLEQARGDGRGHQGRLALHRGHRQEGRGRVTSTSWTARRT